MKTYFINYDVINKDQDRNEKEWIKIINRYIDSGHNVCIYCDHMSLEMLKICLELTSLKVNKITKIIVAKPTTWETLQSLPEKCYDKNQISSKAETVFIDFDKTSLKQLLKNGYLTKTRIRQSASGVENKTESKTIKTEKSVTTTDEEKSIDFQQRRAELQNRSDQLKLLSTKLNESSSDTTDTVDGYKAQLEKERQKRRDIENKKIQIQQIKSQLSDTTQYATETFSNKNPVKEEIKQPTHPIQPEEKGDAEKTSQIKDSNSNEFTSILAPTVYEEKGVNHKIELSRKGSAILETQTRRGFFGQKSKSFRHAQGSKEYNEKLGLMEKKLSNPIYGQTVQVKPEKKKKSILSSFFKKSDSDEKSNASKITAPKSNELNQLETAEQRKARKDNRPHKS